MSGHSKWAKIKRKKQSADVQKGKLFSKLIREITIAARQGGDPEGNPRLRTAIEAAKAANMPAENIKRAIKRGTGEIPGVTYEETSYEGYGPGGVAILIDVVTENKNRTTAEIRHIFSKYGGNLGSTGCVSWMFQEKGIFYVDKEEVDEDTLLEVALEAGADDVKLEEDSYKIVTPPEKFGTLKKALEEKGIKYTDAEITKNPQSVVKLDGKEALQVLKLMDAFEACEEVQHVYANFDIPEEILKQAVAG